MQKQKRPTLVPTPERKPLWLKAVAALVLCATLSSASIFLGTRILMKEAGLTHSLTLRETAAIQKAENPPAPFPLGVNPAQKVIVEMPDVDTFLGDNAHSPYLAHGVQKSWLSRIFSTLAQSPVYQNIASPMGRILIIQSGERKEEVAHNFAKILRWNVEEKERFLASVIAASPSLEEGTFAPGTYVTSRTASSTEVAAMVTERFQNEIGSRYTPDIEAVIPLKDTLTIASLLEREAYDFEDMRLISGIIWNRIFAEMNLQLDASLQYAKGSKSTSAWWPRVVPADKYIKSPYNTYKYEGLPPAPIANPSVDAVLAALNPKKTDCMYYFHDKRAGFHCSVTYDERVAQLKQYYGRGK